MRSLTAGISSSLSLLLTRGIAEITRLCLAMGCVEQTFNCLAVIGDFIVKATSEHCRNNRCGKLMGQGWIPQSSVREIGMEVEGVNGSPSC